MKENTRHEHNARTASSQEQCSDAKAVSCPNRSMAVVVAVLLLPCRCVAVSLTIPSLAPTLMVCSLSLFPVAMVSSSSPSLLPLAPPLWRLRGGGAEEDEEDDDAG